MKKIFILIIFSLSYSNTYSQFQWAKQIGGNMGTESSRVISDGTNAYLIGNFPFGLYLPSDTLYSLGYDDIFITKFDANGNLLWAKQLGDFNQAPDYEFANGVYDKVNNCIYITGRFFSYINFGNGIYLTSGLASANIFVARMELDGTFSWAKKAGGQGVDDAIIAVNPYGKIYLMASTSDSAHFDSIHLGSGGSIIQYDYTGNLLSAESYFTTNIFSASTSARLGFIDADLIIYGSYKINPFKIDTATLITNGNYDGYIARADSMGRLKWIKTFGNTGPDGIQGLSIDKNNNLYISGIFQDSVNLGGIPLVHNGPDLLYAKYDENGNVLWAKKTSTTGSFAYPGVIICDSIGDCYITGAFANTVSMGNTTITATNAQETFVARIDSSGNCIGAENFGETFSITSLARDNTGGVYCNGRFNNAIDFGNTHLTSYGSYDIFLTKMDEITKLNRSLNPATNQLTIYANPNKGICNITVPDDLFNEQNIVLTIYNSTGNIIQQQQVHVQQQKISINIAAEAAGIYTATLGNDNKMYTGKIIFE